MGKKTKAKQKIDNREPITRIPENGKNAIPSRVDRNKSVGSAGILSSYRLQRVKTDGIIEVLNERSYVMAEYSERTGVVRWQRLVLASQRDQIEKWILSQYPPRNSHTAESL